MTGPTTTLPAGDLPRARFAFPGPLRDRLVGLILDGTKVATAGLVADYIVDGDPIPRPGDRELMLDSDGRGVAVIETTRCEVTTVARVTDDFARDEGEGFADAADWWVAHERFWMGYIDDLREQLEDPEFRLGPSTPVVCQWIRVVEVLDPPIEPDAP